MISAHVVNAWLSNSISRSKEVKNCYGLLVLATIFFVVSVNFMSCDNSTISTIQGSGNIVIQERSVSGYDSISFSAAGELNITKGAAESLTITTDDNLMEYIATSVENNVLKIGFREGVSLEPSDTITFDVVVIELNGIVFSGAGTVHADALSVAGTFDLTVSGVADCTIAGQADTQNILISGTCTYEASALESTSAMVNLSGVGNLTLWVSGSLDVTITGVGDVYYYGSPTVTENITGIGKVEKLGATPPP